MLAHFAVGGIVALGVLLVALRGDGRHAGPLSAPQVFQLQDPNDGLCLGARGFVPCDASTLWTVGLGRARRSLVSFLHPSEDARCLDRVQTGAFDSKVRCTSCAAKNSRRWDVAPSHANGAMVMVTSEGAHCLARRSNFAWMQPCPFGHTPLALVESPLHEHGFFIATKGGAACFDGERFRACEPDDSTLYWAAAVRFDGRRDEGYFSFFKMHPGRKEARQRCLSYEPSNRDTPTALTDCSSKGAKRWTMIGPHLVHYDRGKKQFCVKRDPTTGSAVMQPCSQGATHVSLTVPKGRSAAPLPPAAPVGVRTSAPTRATISTRPRQT